MNDEPMSSRRKASASVEDILAEMMRRFDAGEAVDVEDEIALHPEVAMALRRDLAALVRSLHLLGQGGQIVPPLPSTIGGYHLEYRIGQGGEATVYRAIQASTGQRVALKLLPPGAEPRSVQRFRLQQHFAALPHRFVVPVHDAGECDGFHYLAMEWMAGGSLADVVAALRSDSPGALDRIAAPLQRAMDLPSTAPEPSRPQLRVQRPAYVRWAVGLVRDVALALDHAHASGIVHRDVKPSNILLDREGHPHLADFGLARRIEASELTRTGETPGTRPYMSPEQLDGRHGKVDERTDVYSLGVVLYELLALVRPLEADSEAQLIDAIRWQKPLDLRRANPHVPRDLIALVLKCLEKSPEDRLRSAADFAAELQRFLAGQPLLAKPVALPTRWWRLARMHPRVVAGMLAGAASLLLALGYSVAMAGEHERLQEKQRAIAATTVVGARRAWASGRMKQAAIDAERGMEHALQLLEATTDPVGRAQLQMQIAELAYLAGDFAASKRVLDTAATDMSFGSGDEQRQVLALRAEILLATDPAAALPQLRALAALPNSQASKDAAQCRLRLAEQLVQCEELALPGLIDLGSDWSTQPVPVVLVDQQAGVLDGRVALWRLGESPRIVGRLPEEVLRWGREPQILHAGCALTVCPLRADRGANKYHCLLLMQDCVWSFTVDSQHGPEAETAADEIKLVDRPYTPGTGGLRGRLHVLERDTDGAAARVYVAIQTDSGQGKERGDHEIEFFATGPRARPIQDMESASWDVQQLAPDRLLVGLAEWSGFGFLFLQRAAGDWQPTLQRVGSVRAISGVPSQKAPPSFLVGIDSAYRSESFFGAGGPIPWPVGVHLSVLAEDPDARMVSQACDSFLDASHRYEIAVAAAVQATPSDCVHLAVVHDIHRGHTELRAYPMTPPATRGANWDAHLRMVTQLHGIGELRRRDLDGDAEDEVFAAQPKWSPATKSMTVVVLGRKR